MSEKSKQSAVRADEPGVPGESARTVERGNTRKRYSPEQRKALLSELEASSESQGDFCLRHGVSRASISLWKRAVRTHGEGGLFPRESRRNPTGRSGRARSADERRAAVEAFDRAGVSVADFARTFGVSPWTLRVWIARYRAGGPKELEPRRRGRKPGSKNAIPRLPTVVRDEIVRTKLRFPDFGLKKVRDFLSRFHAVRVSTGTVARTLERAGVDRAVPPRRRPKKKPLVRRFERSRPGELWQSDITSFVLTRHSTRVYLSVFLDDFSRFVVSFSLATHQRQELVTEALMDAISRFGKPKEVLTDQGRQYFAWRGKSDFQKLLVREGIEHVVSRTHHPETLGKCERLWETINREFWDRVRPQDIGDARERLAHWFSHYNYFRPHQGIDGLVPADRFFGAQDALRKAHEGSLSHRELEQALEESPRKGVYLFGQIGDEQVALSGERGELVVQTSSGLRQRIGLEELGAPDVAREEMRDGRSGERRNEPERDGSAGQAATPLARAHEETLEVLHPAEHAPRSQGPVGERHGGGARESAQGLHADPVDVARSSATSRSSEGALDGSSACVAAQPTGPGGNARGAPAPTEAAQSARGDRDGRERRRSQGPEEAAGGEGQDDRRSGGADSASLEYSQAQERAGVDRDDTDDENARSETSEPS